MCLFKPEKKLGKTLETPVHRKCAVALLGVIVRTFMERAVRPPPITAGKFILSHC